MTILSGRSIRDTNILKPCLERNTEFGTSHGLGPAGYDVRVEFDPEGLTNWVMIAPGEFVLASTIEHFTMPNYVLGIVHDKSTWARRGLTVQNTVIEPGWKGFLTLELVNHSPNTIKLFRGTGIAQVVFHWIDDHVDGYEGKYQNQERGPVDARSL